MTKQLLPSGLASSLFTRRLDNAFKQFMYVYVRYIKDILTYLVVDKCPAIMSFRTFLLGLPINKLFTFTFTFTHVS